MFKFLAYLILIFVSLICLFNSAPSGVVVEPWDPTIIHGVEIPEEYFNRHIEMEEIKPFAYYAAKANNGTRNTL